MNVDELKVKKLLNEFGKKIRPLLNPTGAETPSQVAVHISRFANLHRDRLQVKGALAEYLVYPEHYVSEWWKGMIFVYGDKANKQMDKVIDFYIKRAALNSEEMKLYKKIQNEPFQ